MQYEVMRDMDIESVSYKAGQRLDEVDIPSGCLLSCVRIGWLVACEEESPVEMPVATPTPLHAVPELEIETADDEPLITRKKRKRG